MIVKKIICAVMLCVVMTLLAGMGNMIFAADAPLENQNYEQNFDNAGGTLPAEWKLKEEGVDITVRNGKKEVDEKEVDDTPALALGSAPWGDKITGTAYLDGYVWNKPYTLDCKILSRQDGDASGNVKVYLNYGGEACYVINVKLGTHATLSKVESSGAETKVAESAGNFDPWWFSNFSATVQDGKIMVSLGSESISYEDSAIKPDGGIAFGANNITAFIDDISVAVTGSEVKENEDYNQSFNDTEVGTLPAEWKLVEENNDIRVKEYEPDGETDETWPLSNPLLFFGPNGTNYWSGTTGTAFLDGYVWNKAYTLDLKLATRSPNGTFEIVLNYGQEESYAVGFKNYTGVTILKKTAAGEEEVAKNTTVSDLWNQQNFAVTISDGKITILNNNAELFSYADAAVKPNGGIAFSTSGTNAFIDDVSVTMASFGVKENEDYNQNFNDTEVGKLPAEWKLKEDNEKIGVRNDGENNQALRLGQDGNDYDTTNGLAYLDGYVWNKPYSLNFKFRSRQNAGAGKVYLNYSADEYYVISLKFNEKATISRKAADGEEEVVATSEKNQDLWDNRDITITVKNGTITVVLYDGQMSWTDSSPITGGGIAFGVANTSAVVDDIFVTVENETEVQENQEYNENFDEAVVGKLPSGWQLDAQYPENFKVVGDGQGNQAFLFGRTDNDYATETGSAYLNGYTWNRPYVLNFTIRGRQGAGVCRAYFSYSADEYYMLELQHKNDANDGRAKIFKKANGAKEETLLATSETNVDIWDNREITVTVRNGKITAFLPSGEALVAVDPAPIAGGGIGFGVKNSSAYFDNIKVTMPDTAVTNFTAYDGTTPITSLNGMGGKTLKVQFAIESTQESIAPIVSVFGNDGSIYYAAAATKTGGNYTAEMLLPSDTPNNAKVKVFMWNGIGTMQPYAVPSVDL